MDRALVYKKYKKIILGTSDSLTSLGYLRLLVNDSFVPSSKQPSIIYYRLTDFKKVNPKCSTLYSKTFFRLTPNQLALYPNWILLYFLKIILPMLVMVAVASKILIKNGKELRREFF